jgi:hypothetical protein
VWRDLARALRDAVAALQDRVPPNPNQLHRPEVAAYEAAYQERVRRRRAQQQQQQGGAGGAAGAEPMFMGAQQQHVQAGDDQVVGVLRRFGWQQQQDVVVLQEQQPYWQQPHQTTQCGASVATAADTQPGAHDVRRNEGPSGVCDAGTGSISTSSTMSLWCMAASWLLAASE